MSIYKRGQIDWYKFTFNGEAIRESTRQKNQQTGRLGLCMAAMT